ncbi:2-succinylbenzoate--CoA ligase [Streptomyces sp. RB5]|uniref:2-succinylbenzoate--CoA ligase n=2 Tax=Streptomyces smaragdinus TaxID=2585196 RepID=A0A7K0CC39_9ACTN|nr:2-succinylbenzoate--CoA ligase [Streptomyces smaragdinus]
MPWLSTDLVTARPCMRDETQELSYGDFRDRVEAAAEQFPELGVGHGSVVAAMLPNQVELLITIEDAGAAPVVAGADDERTAGRPVLLPTDLRTEARGGVLSSVDTGADDLDLLICTSGSTGRPQGVRLDHANLAATADSMAQAIRLTDTDHCLLVLPLFHVNAICVSFLATMPAGGRLSILARFHPVEFLKAVTELRAAEERFGFPLIEGYGLTEGTCASTANPLDGPRKIGTVGVALPGQEVAVMSPDGDLLPAGERGEVVVRGANVMRGYLNRPEATSAPRRSRPSCTRIRPSWRRR